MLEMEFSGERIMDIDDLRAMKILKTVELLADESSHAYTTIETTINALGFMIQASKDDVEKMAGLSAVRDYLDAIEKNIRNGCKDGMVFTSFQPKDEI
jgi:hypothetical protein